MVRTRLRALVRIFRELAKVGSISDQRAWLHCQLLIQQGYVPPLALLKTVGGLVNVDDEVCGMADMLAAAEDLFPDDPTPWYSLWQSMRN